MEGHTPDRPGALEDGARLLIGRYVPDRDGISGRGQPPAVGAERYAVHPTVLAADDADLFSARDLPDADAILAEVGTCGEPLAIRAEGDPVDPTGLGAEGAELGAGGRLHHDHFPLAARRGQDLAVGAEGHARGAGQV